ncbi:MAG TPA: 4Fe-4S dicluster domain-containing protein [Bacteroidales bacterium]|jgi:ferredoxin|nr:4Fe-4S dicluster domain-containing protein [Bacteroidales bacterium]
MGHITSRDAYRNLGDRINWFTQGAPPSESLYRILQVLFTETEAKWVALLPVRPFTAKKAAKILNISEGKAEAFLERLCEKALLVDSFYNGVRQFALPPPMAGFIEFALMRTRGDIDQKYLSELYYQYMNVEEDFIKDLFFSTETQLGRVYVQEAVLTTDNTMYILDYERASHIIDDATYIGLGTCYCRHKMSHVGQPCGIDAPLDVCLTLGNVARSLAENGQHARLIDKKEALDVLERSYAARLVQIGENVREKPAFICNCCGCCCEALQAARRFSPMQPVATTNFIPKILQECVGCGICEEVCPVLAISMQEDQERKIAQVDNEVCLGCGVCVRSCSKKAIELVRREVQVITPVNSAHRFVVQAIEKGTLQNLVFDNQAFANHRAMAAVLGVILKLPPVKQVMASKQFKSIYLDKLLSKKR